MYIANIFARLRLYIQNVYTDPRVVYVYNQVYVTLFGVYTRIKQEYVKNKFRRYFVRVS
jgi:hypothetical protein